MVGVVQVRGADEGEDGCFGYDTRFFELYDPPLHSFFSSCGFFSDLVKKGFEPSL